MVQRSRSPVPEKTYKRVACYVRCSTLEQSREGYGIDTQIRLLKARIQSDEDKGWVFSEDLIYQEDGVSGASWVSERPVLSKLKADILANKIDVLLVWKIDRLFRKTEYLLRFVEFLKKQKVNFVSKNEDINLHSSTGKMVLTMLGAIAEMEREIILERTMEWKISKAMEWYIVYGKYYPFWYSKHHDGRGNKLVVNPEEAEIVKEIFSLFVEEWKGTGEIANILTARGIGTNIDRRSVEENGLRKKLHTWLFRQSSIVRMLRNETYIGKYICNRYKHELEDAEEGEYDGNDDEYRKKRVRNVKIEKPESEWITIECEPIIDRKMFERAQELLDATKVIRRNRWENHLFTGLVKCAECGRTFNFYKSFKWTGQYRCGGKKKDKVSKENLCWNRDISEMKLIDYVWPKIELALQNKTEFLRSYEESLQDKSLEPREDAVLRESAELDAKIAKNRKTLKDTLRKEIENPENSDLYESIRLDLSGEMHTAETRKSELKKILASYAENKTRVEAVSAKMKELKGRIDSLTPEDKGFFIRELTDFVLLSRTDIGVGYRFELSE